ncbi:hypothetical protein FRC08_006158 [Ceratobasidium sp. 394]|nr:hypothetical protein FRC08_006158 [Ceratobasidium sp. 394]
MAQPSLKHLVVVTGFAVSHVRPCLHHLVRLAAKFPGLFISVYTAAPLAPQAEAYLAAHHKDALDRIRIVPSVIDIPIATLLDLVDSMERSFGPWIAEQLASPSVEINGLVVEAPSRIIEDHINGGIAAANKKYHNLPIGAWWVSTAASFMGHFGNAEHGGGWRRVTAVREAMKKMEPGSEKTYEEVFSQELTDRVVCIPGLPPHYEHEQIPQSQPHLLPIITHMHGRWMAVEEQVDFAIFNSVYEMEPIAAEAVVNTLSKPIKQLCVGFAADLPPSVTPHLNPSTSDPVLAFMNRAYTDLGPHSVIYAAFGNYFFPPAQSLNHLKIVIEEIIAQGMRLVFSVKPENAEATGLDQEYLGKLTKSGSAIFPEWAKQLEVLEHPALHYFWTHGGWNSVTEATVRGVPMIFWPLGGDQPTNAMQIARQLDCGFELIQIRTGPAKSVVYGVNGDISIVGSEDAVRAEIQRVLKVTKGERGAQQRLNVQALGKLARGSSMPGGSADVALGALGKAIGL